MTLAEVLKKIEKLKYRSNTYQLLSDLFELFAITISNRADYRFKVWQERENRYKSIISAFDSSEIGVIQELFADVFILLSNMAIEGKFSDYLGELYMKSETASATAGQFFTPYHLSQLCARVTVTDEIVSKAKNDILTVAEPSCGSGGMILALLEILSRDYGINYARNVFVDCTDIDKRCVHMCYLQLSLAGVPAVIRHGNALTFEQWDEWHTPALCMQWSRFSKYVNCKDDSQNNTNSIT